MTCRLGRTVTASSGGTRSVGAVVAAMLIATAGVAILAFVPPRWDRPRRPRRDASSQQLFGTRRRRRRTPLRVNVSRGGPRRVRSSIALIGPFPWLKTPVGRGVRPVGRAPVLHTPARGPSTAKPTPNTEPNGAANAGHSSPNSKLRIVPVMTPSADNATMTLLQRFVGVVELIAGPDIAPLEERAIADKAIPKHTNAMRTANDRACIWRAANTRL